MSKRTRRERKQARLASVAVSSAGNESAIVTGNMVERMTTLAKRDSSSGWSPWGWRQENGHSVYDPEHDERLKSGGANGYGGYVRSYSGYGGGYSERSSGGNSNGNAHLFHVSQPKQDEHTFHCAAAASDEISGCPIAHKTEVYMSNKLWYALVELCGQIDSEWIALLFGKVEDGNYHISHLYFPPQTATGTSVDIPTGIAPKAGVIGALHSHVNMNAFFSQTDKDHSNWPLEIVLNAKGNYEAIARQQLKCGSWSKPDAKVLLEGGKWSELKISSKLRMLTIFVEALERAFAAGKRRAAKGASVAVEDDSQEVDTTARIATDKIGSAQLLPVSQADGLSESSGPYGNGTSAHMLTSDDGSELADANLEECSNCEGIGLVDERIGGFDSTAICPKCNGWGKLLDGKPISAQGPPEGLSI